MNRFFTEAQITELVAEYYSMEVSVKKLSGEYDLNYLLRATDGKKYILKISGSNVSPDFADAQVQIINHLAGSAVRDQFQQHITNKNGEDLTVIHKDGQQWYIRLLIFLEGSFWIDAAGLKSEVYEALGSFLGAMDKALISFSHPAMHRHYLWDISHAADANAKLKYIKDHEKRRIAGYFLLQFQTEVQPVLHTLRHAYIHNDANDTNVLVKDNTIAGLIDFGDMVYSALINNLAVACTYAIMDKDNPVLYASMIVQGYHAVYPLEEKEVDLLYYLIAARLCISVAQSAYNASLETNNTHHFISEDAAWRLLYKWIRINPLKAQHQFRKACGFPGVISDVKDHSSMIEERKKYIGKNLSISYGKNLKIVRGALQYLYDDRGDTYVDCVNNPSHVGHCHPVVVKEMQQQIATLNTNTRYLHDSMLEYAKRLTATLPPSLQVCYFVNSGSEANDLAIRMARHYTQQEDIIVLDHAYHGTSTVAMEMSPYKFNGRGGSRKKPWIHIAESPDLYRGPYRYGDQKAGEKYADDVQRIIGSLQKENKKPAAFICETLLGVGGQMPLPVNYLKEVYAHVKAAGGVCIADEVQVGFGRVGEKFWGFELQDVIPDIVVMGKPIGNGHPLAAVVVSREIADSFNNGMEYFNTFGGNPVSMVTGLAVLRVIEEEEMQQHALETGNYLIEGLQKLMSKHPIISDVRGYGLFIGAELVKDRKTMEPAVPEIDSIVEIVKSRGYLLSTDGPLHNVLKIKPPLPFDKQNADELLQLLDEALTTFRHS